VSGEPELQVYGSTGCGFAQNQPAGVEYFNQLFNITIIDCIGKLNDQICSARSILIGLMTYRHGFLLHLKVDELSFVHKSDFE
jgi:hypothetical protein